MTTATTFVLVVDDDADDQYIIRRAFNQQMPNVSLETVDDGDQLLPYLLAAPVLPKLILLDLNMPNMNGLETLRLLRQSKPFGHLPAIIFTTSAAPEDRRQALALGASDFITKPGDYNALLLLTTRLHNQWLIEPTKN